MADQYKIPYLNAVIRMFGSRFDLTVQQAFRYLYNFKGIRFLLEYYDVEHTLSIEDTVDDLIKVCQKNGGELARDSIMVLILIFQRLILQSLSH